MKTRKAVLDEHTCSHCRERDGLPAEAGDVPDDECENANCRCVIVDPWKYTKLNEIIDSKREFGLAYGIDGLAHGYLLDTLEALAMEIRELKDEIKELKRAKK